MSQLPNLFNTENFGLFSFRDGFSYEKYLEERSHGEHMASLINQHQLGLIASQNELLESGFEFVSERNSDKLTSIEKKLDQTNFSLSDIHESLEAGFNLVTEKLDDINQNLIGVATELQVGFRKLDYRFSLMNENLSLIDDKLSTIVHCTAQPSQTWASEQFELGKRFFNKELYPEALAHFEKSINGFGSNVGDSSNYQPFLMAGLITLGNVSRPSLELIDLDKSFDFLSKAARYYEYDEEAQDNASWRAKFEERSRILGLAGYNRLCAGKPEEARSSLWDALVQNDQNSTAALDMARAQAALGNEEAAISAAVGSFLSEPRQVLKACHEDYFGSSAEGMKMVDQAIKQTIEILEKIIKKINSTIDEYLDTLNEAVKLINKHFDNKKYNLNKSNTLFGLHKHVSNSKQWKEFGEFLESSQSAYKLKAMNPGRSSEFHTAKDTYLNSQHILDNKIDDLSQIKNSITNEVLPSPPENLFSSTLHLITFCILGFFIIIILYHGGFFAFLGAILVSSIICVVSIPINEIVGRRVDESKKKAFTLKLTSDRDKKLRYVNNQIEEIRVQMEKKSKEHEKELEAIKRRGEDKMPIIKEKLKTIEDISENIEKVGTPLQQISDKLSNLSFKWY